MKDSGKHVRLRAAQGINISFNLSSWRRALTPPGAEIFEATHERPDTILATHN